MSLGIKVLSLVPKNTVSTRGCVQSLRGLAAVIPMFVRNYGIDTDEAEVSAEGFATLHELFTRPLKAGARTIADAAIVSPADGKVARCGEVTAGTMVQAKGKEYSMVELLGEAFSPSEDASDYAYATIYLSPTDYHRVHSPAELWVESVYAVPGTLWPVNPMSVNHVDRLFCINERATLRCRTAEGHRVWVVLVGATIVGGIRSPSSHRTAATCPVEERRSATCMRNL